MTDNRYRIPHDAEAPYPLGRHVNHDPRSRRFAVEVSAGAELLVAADWTERLDNFDQGDLGSCTGNAAAGWICTDDALRVGLAVVALSGSSIDAQTKVNEDLAVRIYSRATQLDPWAGSYPPSDTGSDGLSVAKVLKEFGLIERYEHCFTLEQFLVALPSTPLLVGMVWMNDMFYPNAEGFVRPTGVVAGGHEILAVKSHLVALDPAKPLTFANLDLDASWVEFRNSWGPDWGREGNFRLTLRDLNTQLANDGDATVCYAIVKAPEPVPDNPPEPPPFSPGSLLAAVWRWLVSLFDGTPR